MVLIVNKLTYSIIVATPKWKDRYREFCQKAYQDAYVNTERGITKELFSKEIFDSKFVKDYFDLLFEDVQNKKTWLALDLENNILGGIHAEKHKDFAELKGFYVDSKLKGQGIGKKLYQKAMEFTDRQTVRAWVYEYMEPTIKMYENWGFKLDKSKGKMDFNWDPWPRKVDMQAICLVKPADNLD